MVARWFVFKPKLPIWVNFEVLWYEESWYVYGHLEHSTANWYILWPIGNLVVIWYLFPRFGILCQEKSGNPDLIALLF
jgi:hypothetical protein